MSLPERNGRAKPRLHCSILSAAGVLVGLLALAGCGSSSSTLQLFDAQHRRHDEQRARRDDDGCVRDERAPARLALAANPEGQLKYNTKSLTRQSRQGRDRLHQLSPLAHNVTVEAAGGKILGATPTFQGGARR